MLIAITFIDVDYFIIPNEFIIFGFVISIIAHGFNLLPITLSQGFYGLLTFGGTLFLMGAFGTFLFKKEAMGFGDVKLGLVLGSFLGVELSLLALFFSFISINQCTINSDSIDCKELSLATTQPYTSFNDVSDIANLDEDRSNSLSFFVAFSDQIFSGGFQTVYSQYQNFVTQDIQKEMYLTNRTLPRYLNQRYSSENFGTGRYSSLFYVRNTQNLFVNLILSIGPPVLIALFSYIFYLYLKSSNKFNFFIIFFVFSFFFINPFEELSPYMGFIFALLVKMFAGSKNETST